MSVKELKDDVGRYLDEVLAGEEVVIKQRNKPVAKLIPFSANGESNDDLDSQVVKPAAKRKDRSSKKLPPLTDEEMEAHEARLVAEGKMRLPEIEPPPEFWEEFFKEPLADFGDVDLVRFISEDRDEDWAQTPISRIG